MPKAPPSVPLPQTPEQAPDRLAETRARELARLLPLWPHEIADLSPRGRARLAAKLEQALRDERRRGRSGHWTYDLARHAALLSAWRREVAALGVRPDPVKRQRAPALRPAPRR